MGRAYVSKTVKIVEWTAQRGSSFKLVVELIQLFFHGVFKTYMKEKMLPFWGYV